MKTVAVMVLMTVVACVNSDQTSTDSIESHGKRRDAAIDSPPPPPPVDAPAPGASGWVSCYSTGNPNKSCSLATGSFCCFDNYTSSHNGWCTGAPAPTVCTENTLFCDTDNDCASGQKCWARQYQDPPPPPPEGEEGGGGNLHITASCENSPPSPVQAGPWHLCYPGDGTCAAGQACVQAAQAQVHGLPSKIYVCSP